MFLLLIGLALVNFLIIDSVNVTNNRYRLNYHIQPPGGWMNDPDGLVYFNNQYHVFFQYYPYDSNWGPTRWGHAVSSDLVHWSYLNNAISPDQSYDKDGCFSGSAIVNSGALTLVYTGNVNGGKQTQNLAVSVDGVNFAKFTGNPVLSQVPSGGNQNTFKDPKVWKRNNAWYMALCNPSTKNLGRVVIYNSTDLKAWNYIGVLAETKDMSENLGSTWDDPTFINIGGKDVLIVSATGIERDEDRFANLFQVGYFIGSYNYDTNTYTRGAFQELDLGHEFFAAHVFQDPKGRWIVIGWMEMWGDNMKEKADGWAGALTLPRELTLSSDGTRLKMNPVAELTSLRGSQLFNQQVNIVESFFTNIQANSAEFIINITLANVKAYKVGLSFTLNNGDLRLYYDTQIQKLVISKKKEYRQVLIPNLTQLNLRVFIDRSSIEVFANDGDVTMTTRFYVDYLSGISLIAEGGSANVNFQAWQLNSIY